jgi:hypothetical protein
MDSRGFHFASTLGRGALKFFTTSSFNSTIPPVA